MSTIKSTSSLTIIQQRVYDFIADQIRTGCAPTRLEIQQHFGWHSFNAAQEHLQKLERKGMIELRPGSVRGIRLVDDTDARLRAAAPDLLDSLDPDTLEAIASEIGSQFEHSARAHSLRIIARKQRIAIAKTEGRS